MLKTNALKPFLLFTGKSFLNSYSMLFFSNNNVFAVFILIVSFFNPYSGLGGLVATLTAVIAANLIGFSKSQIESGIYTYSALLLGLGMGSFFVFNFGFWFLLILVCIFTVMLSAVLTNKLGKQGLPALSLAFIFSLWLVLLASKEFTALGLTQRNIYWINEMYAVGGSTLTEGIISIENISLPQQVTGFLKSLSAILFQNSILAGALLSIGILIHSRIAFLLMIAGYAIAQYFMLIMGGSASGINYYNIGTNFMLVVMAIGGFYTIPSKRSFFWALLMVPISYILMIGLSKIMGNFGLPVFSLPFCISVIILLYALQLRWSGGKLVLTPIQYFNPETNLYRYIIGKNRVFSKFYFHLSLPIMGEWTVSQGYDGSITHKGDWSKALDFVVLDEQMKTFRLPGSLPEHFYCYNMPVLSPGYGIVEEIVDHIEDNPIGGNNTTQNWGNSIVIKHADGLYSKLSHLKKNSFKVSKGMYVKKGDVLATCGNSGRSPEPHLHFQIQSTPYIGSKTLEYPLAAFLVKTNQKYEPKLFSVPKEGTIVSNILLDSQLQEAFNFQPGYFFTVKAEGFETEEWEAGTNIYNETYLCCKKNQTTAYFIKNNTQFYFTQYYGSKKGLLFYFYQAAYSVLLSTDKSTTLKDYLPLTILPKSPIQWLQDSIAPFYIFRQLQFEGTMLANTDPFGGGKIIYSSIITRKLGLKTTKHLETSIQIEKGKIQSFTIHLSNKTIEAKCHY